MQVTRVCCQAASVSVSEPESALPLDQKTVDLAHIHAPPFGPIPYMHTSSITNTSHHTIRKGHQANAKQCDLWPDAVNPAHIPHTLLHIQAETRFRSTAPGTCTSKTSRFRCVPAPAVPKCAHVSPVGTYG